MMKKKTAIEIVGEIQDRMGTLRQLTTLSVYLWIKREVLCESE